jgi:hypothetical protein
LELQLVSLAMAGWLGGEDGGPPPKLCYSVITTV